jgi:hypothetical protein
VRPLIRLIYIILIYAVATVCIGFTCIFAVLDHDLMDAWPQYLSIVANQLSSPRRALFAWIIVTFVMSTPLSIGSWQAWRIKFGSPPAHSDVACFAFSAIFGSYVIFFLAVTAATAAGPVLSVMENINLRFAMILLGVWSVIAFFLAILAGATVNRLFGAK